MQKLKLLKGLYYQKFFGYRYFDDINITKVCKMTLNLDDISSLLELKKRVFSCHLCELVKTKKNYVFGEGNPHATLMFVGEAPGALEDETGKPFVGRAGELLTKIITNVLELSRDDVYIANIVKCRPPNNQTPTKEIANTCKPYLFKQIELVNPKIIVALGSTAYRYLSGDDDFKITQIRGNIIDFQGRKLIPTYHPSYLLRNPSAKKEVFLDMKKVKALL